MNTPATLLPLCILAACSTSVAQPVIPNDFEAIGNFGPIFSYFGGVQSFGVAPSAETVHSGQSLRCWANFRHDNLFRVAGFAVGTLGATRASGQLASPPDASVFSITIAAPRPPAPETYTAGQLRLIVTLREDDNGDGVIDALEDDDEWEHAAPIQPGTRVYNLPLADFIDTDPFVGDGVRNFGTTGVMDCVLAFETRTTYPGGIIETPRELWIDHAGLYSSPQSLPTVCTADMDGTGNVTLDDLFIYLDRWFTNAPTADLNDDGTVSLQDLFDYVNVWFTPCA
ncbi:MAG: GC-type dockerin domain-anchored protein [Phycisphaerales bacterium]